MRILFDCDPVRADELKSIIYREIDRVVAEGPSAIDFDKTIKNLLKDREQAREHNSFWLSSLYNYYFNGINSADPANYEEILEKMSRQDIQKFAADFFDDADLIDVVFVPSSL